MDSPAGNETTKRVGPSFPRKDDNYYTMHPHNSQQLTRRVHHELLNLESDSRDTQHLIPKSASSYNTTGMRTDFIVYLAF